VLPALLLRLPLLAGDMTLTDRYEPTRSSGTSMASARSLASPPHKMNGMVNPEARYSRRDHHGMWFHRP
jgi:hypothetical protein